MSAITVVFDLDGTLVDSAADLAASINRTLATQKLAPLPPAKLRHFVGHGGRAMIEAALAHHKAQRSPADVDDLFDLFLEDYDANLAVQSKPFPGAVALLDRLRVAGHRLAICTNKREKMARKLLAELNVADRFHAITGRDTLPVHKPDPGHLIGTIILADGDLGRAVMIGDTVTDISTAHAAGLPSVGVAFGYSKEPVASFNPSAVIDHFDELDAVLQRLFPAPKKRGKS